MDHDDDAGAIAASRYFMALDEYSMNTGDLTDWRAISGQTCEFCDNTSAMVEQAYAAGHRLVGQAIQVDEARVLGHDAQLGVYSVELHYTATGLTEIDSAGNEIRSYTSEDAYIVLDVIPSYRGWVLIGGDAQEGRAP